jgi:hypothetical protein
MRRAAIAIAGLLAASACSSLLTPSGSAATRWAKLEKSRAEAAAGGTVGMICKNMVVMGSNFPQKVCSTQAEWDAFNEATRQSADEFDASRRAGNTDSGFERD